MGEQGTSGLSGTSGASAGITSYTNQGDNRVITSVNASTINAESNLTFDGTVLNVTGRITSSGDILVNGITVGNGANSTDSNTAVGQAALGANSTGIANTAIGGNTMYVSSGGSNNTAVGFAAGQDLEGEGNTAIGRAALSAVNFTGNYNIGIGYFAGLAVTGGSGNILIGSGSGKLIANGSDNVIIGGHPGSANLTKTIVLSDASGSVILWGTGSKVTIGAVATPNATLDVRGDTVITGSLTVTGPIRNIVNDGFVSCSLSTSGTGADRTILATFNEVDGTTLTNPRQLVHWWTSTSQFGEAARTFGSPSVTPVYSVTTGSNVTPIASTSGSINHAVTNTSGQLGLRLTTANGAGSATVWFHTEVQGIIYSISTTIFNTGA